MLGFEPLSDSPLSALGPPAVSSGNVFMRGLGTVGCDTGCGCAPSDCCLLVCSPCAIPEKDLTISWVNPLAGNGSDTLVYNGAGSWTTGCSGGAGAGNQLIFTLGCSGGQTDFRAYYFVSGSCPTGQKNYCGSLRSTGLQLILGTSTCSPYSVAYSLTSMSCPAVAGSGYTSFTITDPNPPSVGYSCGTLICVTGCGPEVGATVTITLPSGTVTGTTDSIGCACMFIGSAGSYPVMVAATNWQTYSATLNLTCCGTTSIQLLSDQTSSLTLTTGGTAACLVSGTIALAQSSPGVLRWQNTTGILWGSGTCSGGMDVYGQATVFCDPDTPQNNMVFEWRTSYSASGPWPLVPVFRSAPPYGSPNPNPVTTVSFTFDPLAWDLGYFPFGPPAY